MVGRAAASVAALLDVVDFYVAGSVALGFGDEFFGAANDAARQDAGLRFTKAITIQPSQLREDGPLLGAACVAWRSVSA
jgi:glucokinase